MRTVWLISVAMIGGGLGDPIASSQKGSPSVGTPSGGTKLTGAGKASLGPETPPLSVETMVQNRARNTIEEGKKLTGGEKHLFDSQIQSIMFPIANGGLFTHETLIGGLAGLRSEFPGLSEERKFTMMSNMFAIGYDYLNRVLQEKDPSKFNVGGPEAQSLIQRYKSMFEVVPVEADRLLTSRNLKAEVKNRVWKFLKAAGVDFVAAPTRSEALRLIDPKVNQVKSSGLQEVKTGIQTALRALVEGIRH